MKQFLKQIMVLSTFLLIGCGPAGSSSVLEVSSNEPTSQTSVSEAETSDIVSEPASEDVDYGTVSFSSVFVYGDEFDHVSIRPVFSDPEVCKDEVFEYEIADETVCYIENNEVIFLSAGNTKVTAKSQHLSGSFRVYAEESFPYRSQAVSHRTRIASSYQEGDTLFLGDSFFEFWRNGTNGVTRFDEVFKDYRVFNIGISATTSHDWRAMQQSVVVLAESPKNIVVNIGINNVDDDKESGKNCAANIQNLLEDLLEEFPETNIYYLSITRCSGTFSYNWESHEISNTLMKSYCEATSRTHYLDVMELYGDNYASYQADGLHPNQAGYELFEQIIKENVPLEAKN